MWDKSEVPGGWIYSCRAENGGLVAVFVPATSDGFDDMKVWLSGVMDARNAEIRSDFEKINERISGWVRQANEGIAAQFKHYDKVFTDAMTVLGFRTLGKGESGAVN